MKVAKFQVANYIARFDAFIMSATIPPERHNPKAWANYGCKDTIIFGEMQENGEKIDIFSLENGASAYYLEIRGERYLAPCSRARRNLM